MRGAQSLLQLRAALLICKTKRILHPCRATSLGNSWEKPKQEGKAPGSKGFPAPPVGGTDVAPGCRLQSLKLSPQTHLPPHQKEQLQLQPPCRQPGWLTGLSPQPQGSSISSQPKTPPNPRHGDHRAAETQLKPTTGTGTSCSCQFYLLGCCQSPLNSSDPFIPAVGAKSQPYLEIKLPPKKICYLI